MSSTDPKTENSESTSPDDDDLYDRYEEFLMGGACKEAFNAFANCVEEFDEKNNEPAGKCFPMLFKCMEEHSDYYKPFFEARKIAHDDGQIYKKLDDIFPGDEYVAFMEGGGCRESFRVWDDCTDEAVKKNEDTAYCAQEYSIFQRCMEARSDYYQPYLEWRKSAVEVMIKELDALLIARND